MLFLRPAKTPVQALKRCELVGAGEVAFFEGFVKRLHLAVSSLIWVVLPFVVGACGIYVHGEILGGLVSASAWANLSLRGPVPTYSMVNGMNPSTSSRMR